MPTLRMMSFLLIMATQTWLPAKAKSHPIIQSLANYHAPLTRSPDADMFEGNALIPKSPKTANAKNTRIGPLDPELRDAVIAAQKRLPSVNASSSWALRKAHLIYPELLYAIAQDLDLGHQDIPKLSEQFWQHITTSQPGGSMYLGLENLYKEKNPQATDEQAKAFCNKIMHQRKLAVRTILGVDQNAFRWNWDNPTTVMKENGNRLALTHWELNRLIEKAFPAQLNGEFGLANNVITVKGTTQSGAAYTLAIPQAVLFHQLMKESGGCPFAYRENVDQPEVGIAQFKPDVAALGKLTVNTTQDDRYNPIKSVQGLARYVAWLSGSIVETLPQNTQVKNEPLFFGVAGFNGGLTNVLNYLQGVSGDSSRMKRCIDYAKSIFKNAGLSHPNL